MAAGRLIMRNYRSLKVIRPPTSGGEVVITLRVTHVKKGAPGGKSKATNWTVS